LYTRRKGKGPGRLGGGKRGEKKSDSSGKGLIQFRNCPYWGGGRKGMKTKLPKVRWGGGKGEQAQKKRGESTEKEGGGRETKKKEAEKE